tara:strand:- start:83 stop:295 length:213 start_codon:yes stop_codon:yes gene_type:complete
MNQTARQYAMATTVHQKALNARIAQCKDGHIGTFHPGKDRETGEIAKNIHFCNQCGNRVTKKDAKALGLK